MDLTFDLNTVFEQLNQEHFDGFLDPPRLIWNKRLRSSAGRFIPGSRKWLQQVLPKIEIASYLAQEGNAEVLIRDTLGHEMIHYWLWVRRKPYGHTGEFYDKMKRMGVSRYNPVPRTRPFKWVYQCGHCQGEFPARKRLSRSLACAKCCNQFASGKFDLRFKLFLAREYQAVAAGEVVSV